MRTRVISGIVGVIIAIFVVMNFYTPILDIAAFAIYAGAVFEIYRVFKEGNTKVTAVTLVVLGASVIFRPIIKINPMLIAVAFVVAVVCIVVFDFENIKYTSVASTVALSIYTLFGIYSMVATKWSLPFDMYGSDAAFMFALCGGIAWGGDIMAYFSGLLFGKHKLAPKLSPKKTVEGAIGGVLGSVVIALGMMFVYSKFIAMKNFSMLASMGRNYITLAIFAAIGSVFGIIGDLFASAIKRQAGIKDYGSIMPGHGGVMDRFDSFLFVAPVVYLLAEFISKI